MSELLSERWSPMVVGAAPVLNTPSAPQQLGPSETDRTPEWWVARLYAKLADRASMIEKFNDYYIGDHPLYWVPERLRELLRRNLRMTRTNYMGLVVDAMVERMIVEGFRVDEKYDDELWRVWQANNLDSESDQAFLEAAKSGMAYMLVGPNRDDEKTPVISIEHPSQAIVEHTPGNRRRRAAGLKVWVDDWSGDLIAQLYLPDAVVGFRAKKPSSGKPSWRRDGDAQPNPVGEVPLVELPNNPRLMVGGISELADLTDIQDRINLTVAGRILVQKFGADPQKWATGYPSEDKDGNPQPPLEVGIDRVVTTDVAETKFGQWDAADLDPYSLAKREDVKDIASRSRTPAQYLLSGDFSNVNGETLKASESGLVSKVKQRCRPHGDGLEDIQRMVARLAGLDISNSAKLETVWRNPEFRTEGELTDAVVKRLQARIASLRQSREDVGYSLAQIQRMESEDAEAEAMALRAGMKAIDGAAGGER